MKLAAVLEIPNTMRVALTISIPAILRALLTAPSLLFQPTTLSRIGMDSIWVAFGAGGDENARNDKQKLITPNARGIVLDLGAGHGNTAKYLDPNKVKKYVALEPNTFMHARIRAAANAAGFTEANGTLLILSCGAEDTTSILSSLEAPVETIVSVLTLCTVPAPEGTLRSLVLDVLAPGGALLFLEHMRNHRADIAWWEKMWAPVWRMVFDGCHLDRPTDIWVKGLVDDSGVSIWEEGEMWDPTDWENVEESWFWRQLGRFIKKGHI
ncbi:S-adenosyl-L-methionine-dependent methyltransferase [Mycena pura]|uniref:S-adenosyl-L-methionine-dependent methyltransferase n=1 Tax=Mycena pura TaxID=153505 RepID=A0AAD6UKF6_9AGAR|nr:S-adenosyl-L-methionine-dependent methyltransferase [Mycena pura]